MKKIFSIMLTAAFLLITTGAFAQGNGKGHGQGQGQDKNKQEQKIEQKAEKQEVKTEKKENKVEGKETGDKDKPAGQDADKGKPESVKENPGQGQGHAYGRNKGDMSGREFGQMRSEEAKNKVKTKLDESEKVINEQQSRVDGMRNNVETARKSNEEKYKTGKISKKEYEDNNARIDAAEGLTNEAEQQVKQEQSRINSAKEELNKPAGSSTETNTSSPKRN